MQVITHNFVSESLIKEVNKSELSEMTEDIFLKVFLKHFARNFHKNHQPFFLRVIFYERTLKKFV